MPNFKEYFLQYIWKYQLFDKQDLKTTGGESISIFKTGIHNKDSGPDFVYSEVKIGDLKWVGAVEVHINTSDWLRHKHVTDKNYENVILHVVWNNDSLEPEIPCLELKARVDDKYIQNFDKLIKSETDIPCQGFFRDINNIYKTEMLEKAFFVRINRKSEDIKSVLNGYSGDWEQTTYHILLKNFGFKVNSEAFESIAQKLPLKVLLKHKDNFSQIESLLFGVSGLLDVNQEDEYFKSLKTEYAYLKHKYSLSESEVSLKFLRLRPANFPTIRLSQFAKLIHTQYHLFSLFNSKFSYDQLLKVLSVGQSEYWSGHYVFGKKATSKIPSMGKSSVELLMINTIVPIRVTYAMMQGEMYENIDDAIKVLHEIKAEKNHKLDTWLSVDMKALNSYDGQALLEWRDAFCSQKKCLDCSVGIQILKKESSIG